MIKKMPVQNFKTFGEAEKALWNFSPDATYFEQLSGIYKLGNTLNDYRCPQGVFKYNSIEEAQQQNKEWQMAHAVKKRSIAD